MVISYTRNKNVMLVGLATQTSKKHRNKCVDGSTRYRIKVAKTIMPMYACTSLVHLDC